MFGHGIQFHNRGRIERRYIFYPSHRWLCRSGASIDEDRAGCELTSLAVAQVYFQSLRTCKGRLSHQQVDAVGILNATLTARAKAIYNVALALAHLGHIYGHRACLYAVIRAPTR